MADASYLIEVASSYKGEQTFAQMDTLVSKMTAAGASSETFQDAIVRLSHAQETAAAASSAANTALAAGNAEYAALEQQANQAAKALEKVAAGSKGAVDVNEYRAAALAAQQATAALDAQGTALASLEQNAKQAATGEAALATSMKNLRTLSNETEASEKAAAAAVKKAADDQAKAVAKAEAAESAHERELKKTAGALNGLGGPFGKVGAWALNAADDFGDISKTMGSTNAAALVAASGVAAVGAAVLVVIAVVAAATIAMAAWAIGLADSARSAGLTTEAVEAMNPQLEALHDTIDGLTDETGLTESALDGIAKSLITAKVSAKDLPEALRAAALAERALGQGGASEFLADMKASKKSVAEFSAETQAKLGGVVAKQMLSLGAQSDQLKTNFGRIFGGLDIDPVLSGLSKLVALFDENTAAGQAMKTLFEKVFQPLIDQADNAATVVEAFVLGFLIGLTKLYIAAKPTIKAISEFLGFNDPSLTDTLAAVTKAGEYLVPAFAVAAGLFGAMAAAIGVAVVAVVGIQVAIYSLYAAVAYAAVAVVGGFIDAWHAVTTYLDGIIPGLGDVGTQIMRGLANGISAAAGLPLQAITGAVSGAISGAKNLLGIHSPSKVFAEIGGYTAEGFAQGVDDGAPDAQDAMSNLVAAPSAQPASAAKGSSGSAASITIAEGAVQIMIQGVQGAAEALPQIRAAVIEALEQFAAQATGATA